MLSLAIADLNGDGKADLLVANFGDSSLSVLLGNGDGTFQPVLTSPVGPNPSALVVGDFNRDGTLDIVTSNG